MSFAADLARRADELQHPWQLPFELFDQTPELDRLTPAIVSDDGTVLAPNGVPGPAEVEVEAAGRTTGRRFAFAVLARVRGVEHVLATDAWAEPEARAWLGAQNGDPRCWLIRVERDRGPDPVLRLRGPEPVAARALPPPRAALLVDLGQVLCRFDRSLFQRGFRAEYGREIGPESAVRLDAARLRFERGELSDPDFWGFVMKELRLSVLDRPIFVHRWASILSTKRSTLSHFTAVCALPGVAHVVVSNTDPLIVEELRARPELGAVLEPFVASFHEGVRAKGVDASMWLRAREKAAARLGGEPDLAIAVDDVRTYLHQALDAGAADRALHYRGFGQFRYELGQAGLYVHLSGAAAAAAQPPVA